MRMLLLAGLVAAFAQPTFAEDLDAATQKAVADLATKGYGAPAKAEIRNVHKSRARNGLGYCGEVTVEGADGFTAFHVILAEGNDVGSVLRLSDYPRETSNTYADTVMQLLRNFGCIK